MPSPISLPWTIEDSEKLYQIAGWGEPYFSINAVGNVTVAPKGSGVGSLDLFELVESLRRRNINLPVLIRFPDILSDRIERLHSCFTRAIARYNYPNIYRGVYPVKCNQQRHLLQALVASGKFHQFGLEAGSKPELMIALATLCQEITRGETLLICNGYKDRQYIETALLATRLGLKPIIIIEQLEELPLVMQCSQKLGIEPILGVRAKLSSKGSGRWGNSTGERAKFGLTIPQILQVVRQLQTTERLNCLQLLHFHIGSQISSISVIKDAIREASQIYGELVKLGAKMGYLDVGGGLAVDYDGSKTNSSASKNYNMQNYANDMVAEVKEACEERNIPAPILVSESGRAIAAHQSVLIFDVLSVSETTTVAPQPLQEQDHLIIRNLWETYQSINNNNYQESYHDAVQFKEEAISLFNFGYLSLEERARAEQLYWLCCQKILPLIRQQDYVPEDLANLEDIMASIYYGNLSVFQSIPDNWAIGQLFPIMPIHRLHEEPTQRGILADLTCDSDGKIDQFINQQNANPKTVLELHSLIEVESVSPTSQNKKYAPYYLGMFLVGAYQEIMGSLHNLFGDTNAVHIRMTPKGYQIEHVVKGNTIGEVLGYMQYDGKDLLESIRCSTEQALLEGKITIEEAQIFLSNYESSLSYYTYLNS